jgi:hypothetical protein
MRKEIEYAISTLVTLRRYIMKKINLNSRLTSETYDIAVDTITTILDYLVVAGGKTYNVQETTSEILEKISVTYEKPEQPKPTSTKELFNELGINFDDTFESIFGFHPEDDFETMAKKLAGNTPRRPRRKKKIVRTPFGPITTWVDEEE